MEEKLTYEQALNRLEIVVKALENNETPLEASLNLYKEGINLSKHCNDMLSRIAAEVTVLKKEADDSFTEIEFMNDDA